MGDALEQAMLAGGADPTEALLAGIQARHEITQPLPYLFGLQRRDDGRDPSRLDPGGASVTVEGVGDD